MAATYLSLFTGVGMLDEGFRAAVHCLTGEPPVCLGHCEWEAYAASVLLARMEDASLERAPVWCGDIRELDGRDLCGRVDWLVGGFPCQDISAAGKGEGIRQGNRSGLWFEFARLIREVRPAGVFIENVSALRLPGRGFEHVLTELAALGYDAEWTHLRAADVGAPHKRERIFILAHDPNQLRRLFPRRRRCRQGEADAGGGQPGVADAIGDGGGRGPGDSAGAAPAHGAKAQQPERLRPQPGAGDGRMAVAASRGLGVGGEPPERDGQPDGRDEGLADAGDGQLPQPGRQPEGRDGAGPAGAHPGLGDAQRAEPGPGGPAEEEEERQRRRGSADAGGDLADAELPGAARQREHGRPGQGTARRLREDAAGRGRSAVDDAAGAGPQERRVDTIDDGTVWAPEPAPFPPGPQDRSAWEYVLEQWPHLAPALEPGVHLLVDGLALVVDQSRADQLRCAGNGVVAHQAAAALVLLARRAGLVAGSLRRHEDG